MAIPKRVRSDKRIVWHKGKFQVYLKDDTLKYQDRGIWYEVGEGPAQKYIVDSFEFTSDVSGDLIIIYDGVEYSLSLTIETDAETGLSRFAVGEISWDPEESGKQEVANNIYNLLDVNLQKFADSYMIQRETIVDFDNGASCVMAWIDSALNGTDLGYTKLFTGEPYNLTVWDGLSNTPYWNEAEGYAEGMLVDIETDPETGDNRIIVDDRRGSSDAYQYWHDAFEGLDDTQVIANVWELVEDYFSNRGSTEPYYIYLPVFAVPKTFTEPTEPDTLPEEFQVMQDYYIALGGGEPI